MPDFEHSGIMLYAQLTNDNFIHTVFFELLEKAHELSQKLEGAEISAVCFSSPDTIEGFKEAFRNMGVNKVYYFEGGASFEM